MLQMMKKNIMILYENILKALNVKKYIYIQTIILKNHAWSIVHSLWMSWTNRCRDSTLKQRHLLANFSVVKGIKYKFTIDSLFAC